MNLSVYKNQTRRTDSDKPLYDKAFEIASNSKHNGYWVVML